MTAPPLEDYRDAVRRWVAEADPPAVPTDVDERFEVLRGWQRRLHEAGWLGVDWPVADGGQGLTTLHQAVVFEELIRAEAPFPHAVTNLFVVGPALVAWGTEAQKRRYLPPLLSCDEMWCQGFSEPNAGSDLASLATRAVRDGDELVVSGQKVWTSYAHRSDWCALLARTNQEAPPHKGISYLLVDMRSPGITVRRIRQLTGDAEFCEVFFDDVRVPVENVVGAVDDGWRVAMHSLGNERGRIILQRHAGADVAFRKIVRALRESGVQPSPSVVRRLGNVQVLLASLEAQTRTIAARLAAETTPTGVDSLDKLVLTEVEQEVFALGYDLLGPYRLAGGAGPVLCLDPDRWIHDWLYSRSWSISGGTTQIQRNIVAERVLGLPRT